MLVPITSYSGQVVRAQLGIGMEGPGMIYPQLRLKRTNGKILTQIFIYQTFVEPKEILTAENVIIMNKNIFNPI